MSEALLSALFELSPAVRYVALRRGDDLTLRQRPGIGGASAAESDRYEELLVNPTLLTLAGERGRIDCGGLEFVVIRYGRFYQLVLPLADGHLSVAVEPDADPLALVEPIRRLVEDELGAGAVS